MFLFNTKVINKKSANALVRISILLLGILLILPTSKILAQCSEPSAPPVVSGCSADFVVIIASPTRCDTTLYWSVPTATDDCEITDFTDVFTISNWTQALSQTGDGTMGTNPIYNYSAQPTDISITGTTNGSASDTTNTDLCIVIPTNGTLSFDWQASMDLGILRNDEPGYVLNGVETIFSSVDPDMNSGSDSESIAVSTGDVFCFRVRSNNQGGLTTLNINNLAFNQLTFIQTMGPTPDTSPGAGDGDLVTAGTYEIEYIASDGAGNMTPCNFTITVTDTPPMLICPADYTVNIESAMSCDTFLYWELPTVIDNCAAEGFTSLFNPSNWSFDIFGECESVPDCNALHINNVQGDTSFVSSMDTLILLATNRIPDPTGTVTYDTVLTCIDVPLDGMISFNWDVMLTNDGVDVVTTILGNDDLINDEPGYVLNGLYHNLAPSGSGTASQASLVKENISVVDGDQFCFFVRSPNRIHYSRFRVYDINYFSNSPIQISGPQPESAPGAGDGTLVGPGTYTIGYQYTDNGGQTALCDFEVTVTESTPFGPSFVGCPPPQDPIMVTILEGTCDTMLYWDLPTATDNCDVAGFSKYYGSGQWSLDHNDTGGGDDGSATFMGSTSLEIVGNTNGTAGDNTNTDICIEIPGNGTISFDWCASMSNGTMTPGGIFLNDEIQYMLNGTTVDLHSDSSLNMESGSVSFTVAVGDELCFRVKSNNQFYYSILDITNFSYTNTAIVQTRGPAPESSMGAGDGGLFTIGTHTIEYTASDGAGNTEVCSFEVVVMDGVPPVLDCPDDFTVNITNNLICTAEVSWSEPTATDNCTHSGGFQGQFDEDLFMLIITGSGTNGSADFTNIPSSVTLRGTEDGMPSGSNTDTDLCITIPTDGTLNFDWMATASGGGAQLNNDEFGYTVGLTETILADGPMSTASSITPAEAIVSKGDVFCFRVKSNNQFAVTTAVVENLTFTSVSIMQTSGISNGSTQMPGDYTLNYEATDGNGNTSTCNFVVTVKDAAPPVFDNCPDDITIQLTPGECTSLVTYGPITATDNCMPPPTVEQVDDTSLTSGDDFPIGTTVQTWIAEDAAGNTSVCEFNVVIYEYDPGTITCKDIHLSLDENCSSLVIPEMILTGGPYGCLANYVIKLEDAHGNPVPNPVTKDYLGQTLTYNICNEGLNLRCWGSILVEDKIFPTITCDPDITLNCIELESYTGPSGDDNCGVKEVRLIDKEIVKYNDCDGPYIKTMYNTYIAEDYYGNVSLLPCTQTIHIKRFDPDDIIWPEHHSVDNTDPLDCTDDFDIINTGVPYTMVNGEEVDLYPTPDNICNLLVQFEDMPISNNTCKERIMRRWTVWEWCGSEDIVIGGHIQFLDKVDDTPPMIVCPEDFTVSSSGSTCDANVKLPKLTVSDDCSGVAHVDIDYDGGYISKFDYANGQYINLPAGTHTIKAIVFDGCHLSNECEYRVTVKDNAQPVVICELNTVISMSSGETSRILAKKFDDGSYDRCGAVTFKVRRMEDACGIPENLVFGEYVDFCCEDIGSIVMVALQVTDQSGNSNICMVNVEVQNKTAPIIIGLPNITVNCEYDFDMTDLSVFGELQTDESMIEAINVDDPSAQYSGPAQDGLILANCIAPMVESISDSEINSCGNGYIVRKFTVGTGAQAQVSYQKITLMNIQNFDGDDPNQLQWPQNYETENVCSAVNLTPSDLPSGFDVPVFVEDECDLVSAQVVEENLVENVQGSAACFKILRTWAVIDWCQKNDLGEPKRWTHLQTIKVANTQAPSITSANTRLTFESLAADCGGIEVTVSATGSDLCTPVDKLRWSYEIDQDNNGSVDLLGNTNTIKEFLGVGIHKVTWRVEDACGNFSPPQDRLIEIKNVKDPVAICYTNIPVVLEGVNLDDDPEFEAEEITIDASIINNKSTASCGGALSFSFSSDINDTKRTFTCQLIGDQMAELWVTDANGNQSVCQAILKVQDGDEADICVVPSMLVSIGGNIQTEDNRPISNVEMTLEGSELPSLFTSEQGAYAFGEMEAGGSYVISPRLDENPLNGLSTLDIVLIQKHILGLQLLDSPYKILAADVNNNQSISATDIVLLRKLILGAENDFEAVDSWSFIPAGHKFYDTSKPWIDMPNHNFAIAELKENLSQNFIGYKMGDVNYSAKSNYRSNEVETRSSKKLNFLALDREVRSGDQVELMVTSESFEDISGFQFTLDHPGLRLMNIAAGSLDLSIQNAQRHTASTTVSWNTIKELNTKDVLFTLVFEADYDLKLSDQLTLSSRITTNESYHGSDLQIGQATLSLIEGSKDWDVSVGRLELYQNEPNPWQQTTVIGFELPRAGAAELKLYDGTGKFLRKLNGNFGKGYNAFELNREGLPESGILIYELRYEDQIATKRMVIIR